MKKQFRYVWNGADSEDLDKDILRSVRKLIILDGIDEPEIVETLSHTEYETITTKMQQDGWELEATNVKGNPRTTLWVRYSKDV